jgi:SAM-dependent methyltransferase
MTLCRVSGEPLIEVLDLGMQPLGNGFSAGGNGNSEYSYHLRCGFSEISKLFQLIEQPPPAVMFNDTYAFLSSTSSRMKTHFRRLAQYCKTTFLQNSGNELVVEIGCNDGIFLEEIARLGVAHLGVEPSGNVEKIAASKGLRTVKEFFSLELARSIREEYGPASVVVATNVLCHIANLNEIALAIRELLTEDGVLITEDPYLGSVLRLNSYDQIYDEHVYLFSALSISHVFHLVGLELIDVEPQDVHGGSMRYVLARSGRYKPSARTQLVLSQEISEGLHEARTFFAFSKRVSESASSLKQLLLSVKKDNGSLVAFGATSKSTTIYNYAGIGPDLISKIYDNTPTKIGKFSPGVNIPIVSSEMFPEIGHGHVFLAAWNHEKEIRRKYAALEQSGRRWIVHVPSPQFLNP